MSQFWDTYTPDCNDCKSYEREVSRLKRELAAAKEDTARLDWLEKNRQCLNNHYGTNYGWKVVRSCNVTRVMAHINELDLNDAEPRAGDIRSAIDDARKEQ